MFVPAAGVQLMLLGERAEVTGGKGREAAVLTVYLWDAATWSGVSDSLDVAQRRVTARMGQDGRGRIEVAGLAVGVSTLTRVYERTGRGWTANRRPDGTVSWVPVGRERLREVS